jgi:glycosyltransferase involved in cell wall biosynthesis
MYSHRSPPKDTPYEINLVHFGSTTHFYDLTNTEFEKGIDRIFKEYPNVIITTIGHSIATHANRWGARYRTDYGHSDIYKWITLKFPQFMDDMDIAVVPLVDSVYNKCKSSIKYLEMSSAIKPGVWQDIRQYREVIQDGKNGFLASTADDWYRNIKLLLDDVQLRRYVGEKAFETVKSGWTIQKHVDEYAQYFIDELA